eukprot:10162742-Prorocentrum_lima.AAC.1
MDASPLGELNSILIASESRMGQVPRDRNGFHDSTPRSGEEMEVFCIPWGKTCDVMVELVLELCRSSA